MKRIAFLLLVLLLAGCALAPSRAPGPAAGASTPGAGTLAPGADAPTQAAAAGAPVKVSLAAADGVSLKGTFYPPRNSTGKADALLLLHEAYGDSRAWEGFARAAQARGYAVLTLDLRGHGQSGGEKTFDPRMDQDVEAALTWLRASQVVNSQRMGMVGASLGANLALRGGARHAEIRSVIMLSPGMSLWQVGIAEVIGAYGARPLLLVAAQEDAYPAGSVQTLNDQALGPHQLKLYPGAEHGTKLFAPHPDLTPLMLDWLQQTMQ